MNERFSFAETYAEQNFSEFETAIDDTVVMTATRIAKDIEFDLNASKVALDSAGAQEIINHLDRMVTHVLHEPAEVSGRIWREGESTDITQLSAIFSGYSLVFKDDKLAIRYYIQVPVTEDGDIVTEPENQTAEDTLGFTADFDDVSFVFEASHAIRAHAYLSIFASDTLKVVDDALLGINIEAREVHEEERNLSTEAALLRLGKVSLTDAYDEDYARTLGLALTSYVNGMLELDRVVPYAVTVSPQLEIDETYIAGRSPLNNLNIMATFNAVRVTYVSDEGESKFNFVLECQIHPRPEDLHQETLDVFLPLNRVESIRSIRSVYFRES